MFRLNSENGNRQNKDLKDKPDSAKDKPDSSTKEKPYLSPRDKPYLSPRDKPYLSPRDSPTKRKPDSSTRDKRDWSPRDKRDWSPRDKRDRSPRDKKDLSPRRKSDTTRKDKPDSRRQKADSTTKNKPESAKVEKPDLISKATTEGLSDWEFEEILRKERLNKTISLRDMIAGLQAREKYREDNNMNPSLEKILTNPKVESNAKDIVGVKCVSETKDISKLIIVQHENIDRYKKGQSFDILRHSATQCGMLLQWWQKCVYTKHPQIYKCSIWLERQFLGEGYSTSFDDSKTLAANIVLKDLYLKRPVISIKGGKAPANKKTIQYKEITEKSKILMTATGEKIPPKLPKINDWIIQICKEYITEYKESDIVEVFKFTPGYTEEEISLIQSFSVAMGLRCNYQKGKSIVIHKMIDPAEVLKKLTTPGTTDKNYRFVNSKEKRKIVEKFKN